jgi:hypothetical protein
MTVICLCSSGTLAEAAQQMRDRVNSYNELVRELSGSASLDDTHACLCRAHAQRLLLVLERAAMPAAERAAVVLQPTSGGSPWLAQLARACQAGSVADSGAPQPWRTEAARQEGDMRFGTSPIKGSNEEASSLSG